MSDLRASIDAAVRRFRSSDLETASIALFSALGYRSAKTIALTGDPSSFAAQVDPEDRLAAKAARLGDWVEVRFLFQLTNDEIPMLGRERNEAKPENYGKSIVDSFVFLAVALEGDQWTRSALAGITRAVNGVFAMPVVILFRYGGRLSIAVSERRQHKRDAQRDVQTGRISIILDIDVARPHAGHIRILESLHLDLMRRRPSNFEELYQGWLAALSTKTLNERFYRELANWFFWAREEVRFPDGAGATKEVPLIRLLTRVIFCWFLREKGLIDDVLFRADEVSRFLKHDPRSWPGKSDYYKAILQNLFFATLNTEMKPGREWRTRGAQGKLDGQYMIHSAYRYRDLFDDPEAALAVFRGIPFLNGGLFECLDSVEDSKQVRVDGFSDRVDNVLTVPNEIFFGDPRTVDLNTIYETKGKTYIAKGLFTLFDEYVFTVEENTVAEEAVALDPELLGKVFENLLASYNDETSTTARKKSGAFYTPRYVVDYMVRETLTSQFVAALTATELRSEGVRPRVETLDLGPAPGELAMERAPRPSTDSGGGRDTGRIRALLDPSANPPQFSEGEAETLVAAIEDLKILDPACGSGAFPMGMLQALMGVLERLDPDNSKWRARNRRPLEARLANARAYDVTRRGAEEDEAAAALAEFDAEFADNGLANYVRKLHLIEKCLYGADIQPIAILIAKLRFFISLAVEQKPHKDRDNLGIKPLPNLETKLVAANSLIPLYRPRQDDLFANPRIRDIERELERATQSHFAARTMKTKRKYRAIIADLRDELSHILQTEHALNAEDAKAAAAWNPFDQNASAPFFDPLWMFQLHHGFDIVIGNPPYVRQEKIKDQKAALQRHYGQKNEHTGQPLGSFSGTADLFVYFIERGLRLLKEGGSFAYITSNKWYRAKYGENLRLWVNQNARLRTVVDFGDANVFDAIAYPTVVVADRRAVRGPYPTESFRALNWTDLSDDADKEAFPALIAAQGFDMPQSSLEKGGWQLEPTVKRDLLARIRAAGVPLGDYVEGRFYRGILTGYNDAFVIDGATRDALIRKHAKSADIIKPFLRGRDIKRWRVEPRDRWLVKIESSSNVHHPWTGLDDAKAETKFRETWPAIYEWFASEAHYSKLQDRYDKGRYFWELRACDYWSAFEEPKIIVPAIEKTVAYAPDTTGFFSNDKTSIVVTSDWRFVLACLNSPVSWWITQAAYAGRAGGFFEFKPMYVSEFPVPLLLDASHKRDIEALTNVMAGDHRNAALEQLLNGLVYELYFREDLHTRGLKLFDAARAAGLDRLADVAPAALAEAVTAFARDYLAPGKPLRTMLSDLQTVEVVRIIEGRE